MIPIGRVIAPNGDALRQCDGRCCAYVVYETDALIFVPSSKFTRQGSEFDCMEDGELVLSLDRADPTSKDPPLISASKQSGHYHIWFLAVRVAFVYASQKDHNEFIWRPPTKQQDTQFSNEVRPEARMPNPVQSSRPSLSQRRSGI
jgi:hypothetical protein